LADCGLLEIYQDEIPICMEQAYSLIEKEGDLYNMDHYLTYVYLKRLGFVVLRTNLYNKEEKQKEIKKESNDKIEPSNQVIIKENNQIDKLMEVAQREWYPPFFSKKSTTIEIIPLQRRDVIVDYSQLQLFNVLEPLPLEQEPKRNPKLFIAYDIYQNQGYHKKSTQPPSWRLCVCGFQSEFPSVLELKELGRLSFPVPVKYCIVSSGTVNFLEIE